MQWYAQRKNIVRPFVVRNFPRRALDPLFNNELETGTRILLMVPRVCLLNSVNKVKEEVEGILYEHISDRIRLRHLFQTKYYSY